MLSIGVVTDKWIKLLRSNGTPGAAGEGIMQGGQVSRVCCQGAPDFILASMDQIFISSTTQWVSLDAASTRAPEVEKG
jgi:hypothetical protein